MARRKPYECFRCRDNGFPNTMVHLAGKDDQGKTLYVEDDGTAHQHKQKQGQQQEAQTSTAGGRANNPMPLLRIIDAKLERVIALLGEEKFRLGQTDNNVPQ